MSVIRLIFRDALPQKKYDVEGHVILRCVTHDDASIGEILLTTIAQVYTTDRGGFCYQSTGGNVVSANDVEHLRWRLFTGMAASDAMLTARMEKEIALRSSFILQQPRNTISVYVAATKDIEAARHEMELFAQMAITAISRAHEIKEEGVRIPEDVKITIK
ncbi:hypothetical protein O988_02225 [Pseudogymnoascus sp. VKM F-3808]|nr:hypothetical protein O988_02225 [Pseudogymnoascus sp. VKM F-3808]